MKQTLTENDFINWFKTSGNYRNNFTYHGLIKLFNYLEEYEESIGEEIEFDPISLCCEFTEYENLKEFQENYGDEYKTFEDIEFNTIVIPVTTDYDSKGCHIKSFIIQDF